MIVTANVQQRARLNWQFSVSCQAHVKLPHRIVSYHIFRII